VLNCRDEEGVHPLQARVVSTLREHFGHLALFFWDQSMAEKLHVVWRPKVLFPHAFGLLQTRHRLPLNSAGATIMALNVVEVLHDMLAASDGLLDIAHFC
jgi:hypothetical protein